MPTLGFVLLVVLLYCVARWFENWRDESREQRDHEGERLEKELGDRLDKAMREHKEKR